ncbi:NADP-dependent isocitrate dehydrogenase, partial [Escherichia coli]|uniref:NADP-dependent isocitrate dehydrogenase n=1 Tax=Escherichia coli TaxID=562 RepID=UPI0020272DB0
MGNNDFFSNEQSVTIPADDVLTIRHTASDGSETVLKSDLKVLEGEIVDATFMSVADLDRFLAAQIQRAKDENVLFSV